MSDEVQRLLDRLEAAWAALTESYASVPESKLVEPGVVDDWSVRDVLAHVIAWEQEALWHLPLIIAGGTPPRYAAQGGVDAFNARATEAAPRRSLAEVLRWRDQTHARLPEFIRGQPEGTFAGGHGRDAACGWTPGATTRSTPPPSGHGGHTCRHDRRGRTLLSGGGPGAWHVAARAWPPSYLPLKRDG